MKQWQRTLRLVLTIAMTASVCLAFAQTASACPSCKEALAANSAQGGDIVRGYFWSILFMMSMPFAIVTGFGTSMYVAVRRARAVEDAKAREDAGDQPAGPADRQ